MLFKDSYKMIDAPEKTVYKSKGSKFLAFAYQVKSELEIKEHLKELKMEFPDASHYCYSWVLGLDGSNFRINDDGEPSSTAGKPIYREILKHELTNILVVVVRYFGGTLLGVPGLIEAYGNAGKECLDKCTIQTFPILEIYQLQCPYGEENEMYRLSKQFQTALLVKDDVRCYSDEIKIPLQQVEEFKRQLKQFYRVSIEYKGVE
jgi:uncharacterized YigZ family protein